MNKIYIYVCSCLLFTCVYKLNAQQSNNSFLMIDQKQHEIYFENAAYFLKQIDTNEIKTHFYTIFNDTSSKEIKYTISNFTELKHHQIKFTVKCFPTNASIQEIIKFVGGNSWYMLKLKKTNQINRIIYLAYYYSEI